MAQFIIHKDGVFNLYTTICDGAIYDGGLTEEQLYEHFRREYGESGVRALPPRLERAKEKGTSAMMYDTLEELVSENSEKISAEEFIAKYLTIRAEERTE